MAAHTPQRPETPNGQKHEVVTRMDGALAGKDAGVRPLRRAFLHPGLDASLIGALVLSAIVLGGGTRAGFLGDALLQLLAVPILAYGLIRLPFAELDSLGRAALMVAAAIALLPLVQLVPLPPALWTHLPGRDAIVALYRTLDGGTAGALHWRPISLSPQATWNGFLALIPPLAIFLVMFRVAERERRALALLLVGLAIASVVVGFAQFGQGPDSPLYFFAFTNRNEPVGFFANRNHFAALLYSALLLAAAFAVGALKGRGAGGGRFLGHLLTRRAAVVFAGLFLFVLFFAALGMTRSRAGLALAIVGTLGVFTLGVSRRATPGMPGRGRLLPVVIAVAIAVILVLQFALYRILERFDRSILEDLRPVLTGQTLTIAADYLPFGSGIATFVPVYKMHEPAFKAPPAYINRAHNDFAELWLEGGFLAASIAAAFIALLFLASLRLWAEPPPLGPLDLALARAGALIVWLLLAHSLVDYPLRTSAMASVLAFAAALALMPRGTRPDSAPAPPLRREGRRAPTDRPPPSRRPAPAPSASDPADESAIEWPEEWLTPPKGRHGRPK